MNLGRLMSDTARLHGDRPALVRGERAWTWRELDERVNAAAQALRGLPLDKGDRLLLLSANSPGMFEAMWAAFKAGLVLVPVNFRLAPPEVAAIAANCRARAMLYGPGHAAHADAARAAAPSLERLVALADPRAGEGAWEDFVAAHRGAAAWEEAVAYDDLAWLFYTSGTTGRSKGAMLSHGMMSYVAANMLADLMPGLTAEDASLVVAPLSHGAGAHLPPNVARGARTVLPEAPGFDAEEVWRLVETHRISNMFTVPTIVKMMVEHPAIDAYDHSSLRHVVYAGAPMYREDQKRALEKLGPVLVQYYGMGEVPGTITYLPAHMHTADDDDPMARPGTCGIARTGMEIAVRGADGAHLPPGEQGEICVRGPAVLRGYYDDAEADAKAFRDGWFHTGDLGRVDEEGFVYLTGRASDMYISGGANVYPREVEEALLGHPAVSEVAIVGVPDAMWGEAGVAVVVAAPGTRPGAAELAAFLDGRVARYKLPRRFFLWDEIPKSAYGKVPKRLVRERLYARGDLEGGEG